MKHYEAFISAYDGALDKRTHELQSLLTLQAVRSCYRDTPDSQVYLVEDGAQRSMILKCGRGERRSDARTDVYGLGMLFIDMITCPQCGGSGMFPCISCGGRGVIGN